MKVIPVVSRLSFSASPGLLIILFFCQYGAAQSFKKMAGGVIVYPAAVGEKDAKAVRVTVVTDRIIRVTASPSKEFAATKSLMVFPAKSSPVWKLVEKGNNVELQTERLNAVVSLNTGAVSFSEKDGELILKETPDGGRLFTPATVDGEKQFGLYQSFETEASEAFYGLGQHQEGIMNYRGESIELLQQNSDVAVPFLVSTKNYGILWDNYSISEVGDARKYESLSGLQLFDKKGNAGGLTASYFSRNAAGEDSVVTERTEAGINYPYLDNMRDFPAGYRLGSGDITWEGSIMPNVSGDHKFHLYSGGYIKVWLDGKLVADGWRQSWNPASTKWHTSLEKGKKYDIKIRWNPDGGESYLSLKYLSPLPGPDQNKFALSSEAGDQVDYYFVSGANMDAVIGGYRQLTGKATMLPKWALGFWQSRERYKTQDEILNTVAEFRKRGIGLDNIVLDWSYWKEDQWGSQEFDTSRFPDAAGMIKKLHNQYHTNFMISVWPKYYTNTANYAEMNAKGYLYKRNVELGRRDWIGQGYTSTFYDAYNAGARALFWKQINEKLYSKGVDAWWMDASEPDIHSNVNIEDRKDFMNPTALGNSTRYFNAYALQNAKGIYEGQRSVDPNKRVFILTRSAYAGMQRYAAATWSGDIGSRWRDMKNQIAAGVNFSMSGLPYWTMDVGGFAVEKRYEKPNEADKAEWQEQMTRWYQFGAFAPIFRVHGQFPYREIFNTAPDDHPAYKSMLFYNRLRYRLMPYIYSLAGMAYQNNYTIMRGLIMDFPKDGQVKNINDQFLFGPAFLISPVTEYKATSRQLYLPAGTGWYNAYSGGYETGGQTITADAPYERMPLFIKEGAIIPMGPVIEYTMQKQADTLMLFVYAGKDGNFSLYEDEGINYNYEKGRYSTITFNWNDEKQTFTVGQRKGSFTGMLTNRVIKVVKVNRQHPLPLDADANSSHTIRYSGNPVSMALAD
jgi:alpha-D-xyloside xylohydrolase